MKISGTKQKAGMDLFDIILTKVHLSLSHIVFIPLIWNSDEFVSIIDLCNFNGLFLFILR